MVERDFLPFLPVFKEEEDASALMMRRLMIVLTKNLAFPRKEGHSLVGDRRSLSKVAAKLLSAPRHSSGRYHALAPEKET